MQYIIIGFKLEKLGDIEMNELFIAIFKYMKILLVALIVISLILAIVSTIFDFVMSTLFLYAAIVSFALGFLSVSGSTRAAGSPQTMRMESMSSKSVHDHHRENRRLRDSSYGFLIFMTILGVLLVIISNILAKLSV